jgi:hypothetical protein
MRNEEAVQKWKTLYRIGAIAILVAIIFFRRNYGAEISAFNGFGIFKMPEIEPTSALEWFEVLQDYPYVGLSWLGLYDLVNFGLVGLFILALYAALKDFSPSLSLVALISGLLSVGVYWNSNQAFALLGLSNKFTQATTASQKDLFLAAGEGLLAIHNPTLRPDQGAGVHISLFLVFTAGL